MRVSHVDKLNVTTIRAESKEGVLASNGRGQVVEAFERVVGDFQVEEGRSR